MKTLTLFVVLLTFISCASIYVPNENDAKDFFAQATPSLIYRRFILIDSIETHERLYKIFKRMALLKDTVLTKADIAFICNEMRDSKKSKWTNSIFAEARIVPQSYIDSVGKPNPTKQTPIHYRLSYPWFSKNKRYCVFYYDYYCGSLCAEKSLFLYEKIDGKWKYVLHYFREVS